MHLPDHAYVPGQTSRHPEDTFAALRATATGDQDAHQLAQSHAFRAGLRFLAAAYYWEAHEVLEPVWLALPEESVERRFVQGLIQLANGCLKLRMGRLKAALRLVGQARGLMPAERSEVVMTLDVRDVHEWIDSLEKKIICAI